MRVAVPCRNRTLSTASLKTWAKIKAWRKVALFEARTTTATEKCDVLMTTIGKIPLPIVWTLNDFHPYKCRIQILLRPSTKGLYIPYGRSSEQTIKV